MSPFDSQDDLETLRAAARDVDPPPEVEDRVVAALRERSLIGTSGPSTGPSRGPRWAMAAALVVGVLGGWVARGVASGEGGEGGARAYLVALTEPDGLRTEKSVSELVDEYRRWAGGLRDDGHLVAGRRLLPGGRHLSGASTAAAPDPPASPPTGFFLIRAETWDEAEGLLSDCPHLAYGGDISLWEVARDG